MQHISSTLNKYQKLSLAQFNHIKKHNVTDFQVIGNISDPEHPLLQYKDYQNNLITVFSNGEVYQD